MKARLLSTVAVCAAVAGLFATACDRAPEPAPAAAPATRRVEGPRRIALVAVPLTAEVPPTWDVRRATGGALVLSGRAPSGEREIALRAGPSVATADLPATQPFTPDAPGSPSGTRVDDRDGMRVVERLERTAAIDQPADIAPLLWSFRFIVPGRSLEQPSYELDVVGLTQLGYERDEATLRPIFDSVRPADAP